MRLNDLKNINISSLQTIDWRQAVDLIRNSPDLLINVLMAILTAVTIFSSIGKYTATRKSLQQQRMALQQNSEALKRLESTQGQYKTFMENAPKIIGGDKLIETLSEFAVRRNVQIMSFSPAKEKSNNFISVTSVNINIAADNYADVLLFMNDIEGSPYSIRIGKWTGSSAGSSIGAQRRQGWQPQKTSDDLSRKDSIEATIQIESIEYKNV